MQRRRNYPGLGGKYHYHKKDVDEDGFIMVKDKSEKEEYGRGYRGRGRGGRGGRGRGDRGRGGRGRGDSNYRGRGEGRG